MDILSAIVCGELQQHESQGLPGWCHFHSLSKALPSVCNSI
jgi:hypothetical protein